MSYYDANFERDNPNNCEQIICRTNNARLVGRLRRSTQILARAFCIRPIGNRRTKERKT